MTTSRFTAKNGLDNSNQTITNVADPVNATDAATKQFSSNASNLTTGTIASARLGTGTADSTTYLRGDGTWNSVGNMDVIQVTASRTLTSADNGKMLVNNDTINHTLTVAAGLPDGFSCALLQEKAGGTLTVVASGTNFIGSILTTGGAGSSLVIQWTETNWFVVSASNTIANAGINETYVSIGALNAAKTAKTLQSGLYKIPGSCSIYEYDKITDQLSVVFGIDRTKIPKLTPTVYFDVSAAATSTGAGTLANPFFTHAHLTQWLSDLGNNAFGEVLGLKYGTVIPFEIGLDAMSHRNEIPFYIIPYGDDSLPLPKIDTGIVRNDWTLFDATYNIYTRSQPRATQFWQVINAALDKEKRVTQIGADTLANKLARLRSTGVSGTDSANGNGYFFWDASGGGTVYMRPHNGADPRNSNILISSNDMEWQVGGNSAGGLHITSNSYGAQGGVVISGIAIRHAGGDGISVKTFVTPTSFGRVVVSNCDIRHVGINIMHTTGEGFSDLNERGRSGGGSDGIAILGSTDTVRGEFYSQNNYFEDIGNNTTEFSYVDGYKISNNYSTDVYGNGWAELYASASNGFVENNIVNYDTVYNFPWYSGAGSHNGINTPLWSGTLVWFAGLNSTTYNSADPSPSSIKLSVNNVVCFNRALKQPGRSGIGGSVVSDEGTEKLAIYNNLIHFDFPVYQAGKEPIVLSRRIGQASFTANPTYPATWTDNVVIFNCKEQTPGSGNTGQVTALAVGANATPSGATPIAADIDRNIYWFNSNKYMQENINYRRADQFYNGSADGTQQGSITAWTNATGYDRNSKAINALLDVSGDFSGASLVSYKLNKSEKLNKKVFTLVTTAAPFTHTAIAQETAVDISGVAPTALSINFPPKPANGDEYTISTSVNIDNVITLVPTSGAQISGAITNLTANSSVRYSYRARTNTWIRFGIDSNILKSSIARRTSITGYLSESIPRNMPKDNLLSIIQTGRVGFVQVYLTAGQIVTGISFCSQTSSGASLSNQVFGLYDINLNRLAVTNDDTSTAWAATTIKTLTLTAPYTVTTTGYYYAAFLVVATTVPSLLGVQPGAGVTALTPYMSAISVATGLTSLPATATVSGANTQVPWCGIVGTGG